MYSRREVLRLAAALGLLPVLPQAYGCGDDGEGSNAGGLPEYEYNGPLGPANLFRHGVASGDPLSDAVILWTRVSPESDAPLDVFFEIARDELFADRVGAGWMVARPEADFTVKLDATGLEAGSTYFFRFRALGRSSTIGRTRTAPVGLTNHLRLAVVSCSSYAHGYFHAYRNLAQRDDLDVVLHLGDYIYEYGSGRYGTVREYDPPYEIVTLADYRRRYAHYRADADLQAVHAAFPFITVWDDHETANDAWMDGAENHDAATEGEFAARKAAAQQAYSEWMPIRVPDPSIIFRALAFGDLVDLMMLDTRIHGRDEQAPDPNSPETRDPLRTILGLDQEAWLFERLRTSTAHWRFVGQQVVFGQLKAFGAPNADGTSLYLNADQWDGYQGTRQRFFDVLRSEQLGNVVVFTGDIHSSGAGDLTEDPNNPTAYDPASGDGSLAVEIVAPGVTSPGIPDGNTIALPSLLAQNPHLKWADLERRGYVIVDVDRVRVRAEWHLFDDISTTTANESLAATIEVASGTNRVTFLAG